MKKSESDNNKINLASLVLKTRVLGPGIRSAIWVQGCPFHCKGCIAPEWIHRDRENWIDIEIISNQITELDDVEGLTISGGEPFLQALALSNLIKSIKEKKDINIICYTGYLLENLLNSGNGFIYGLLSQIDVLIDGPYIKQLNDGIGLRGSSNQNIHYLTEKLFYFDFLNGNRNLEMVFNNNHVQLIGIPPNKTLNAFNQVFENWERSNVSP